MTDQIISIATAKKAKEKGFNLECWYYYSCDKPVSGKGNVLCVRDWANIKNIGSKDSQDGTLIYSAPYQNILQCWLRKQYRILVMVTPLAIDEWEVQVFDVNNKYVSLTQNFISCEDATEFGLMTGLLLIK